MLNFQFTQKIKKMNIPVKPTKYSELFDQKENPHISYREYKTQTQNS